MFTRKKSKIRAKGALVGVRQGEGIGPDAGFYGYADFNIPYLVGIRLFSFADTLEKTKADGNNLPRF